MENKEEIKKFNLIDFINDIDSQNGEGPKKSPRSEEYLMYAEKFKQRYGREPYILCPSGTEEEAIEAMKYWLEKDDDNFVDLYDHYPKVVHNYGEPYVMDLSSRESDDISKFYLDIVNNEKEIEIHIFSDNITLIENKIKTQIKSSVISNKIIELLNRNLSEINRLMQSQNIVIELETISIDGRGLYLNKKNEHQETTKLLNELFDEIYNIIKNNKPQ